MMRNQMTRRSVHANGIVCANWARLGEIAIGRMWNEKIAVDRMKNCSCVLWKIATGLGEIQVGRISITIRKTTLLRIVMAKIGAIFQNLHGFSAKNAILQNNWSSRPLCRFCADLHDLPCAVLHGFTRFRTNMRKLFHEISDNYARHNYVWHRYYFSSIFPTIPYENGPISNLSVDSSPLRNSL